LKPSVCWQLPIKVDWEQGDNGTEVATVRAWTRADWGAEGKTMAWCCTEGTRAYVGERPVIESMAEELQEIIGSEVYTSNSGDAWTADSVIGSGELLLSSPF
jgi:hypothetical protein